MATIGNTKRNKMAAAKMRRVVRGAKKMGIPLPGHGKNTPTADVERLQTETAIVEEYWRGK